MPIETKICNVCEVEKPVSDFYFRSDQGKYRANCKKCKTKPLDVKKPNTDAFKVCKICKQPKHVSEYQLAGKGKWLQPYCKPCDAERKREYNINNDAKVKASRKEYYEENKDEILERNKKYFLANRDLAMQRQRDWRSRRKDHCLSVDRAYRKNNKERLGKKSKAWRDANKERVLNNQRRRRENNKEAYKEYHRQYRINNKDKLALYKEANKDKRREQKRVWCNEKSATDISFRILKNLRSRMRFALKNADTIKSDTTVNLLGCSIPFFKKYFESLFTDGMTWNDFMAGKIHIDHYLPCKVYELTNPEDQRRCFNYNNLRPMWAEDNLKKGASLDHVLSY